MRRRFFSFAISLMLISSPLADEPKYDVLVICPPTFRDALGPWIKHRENQGHRILVDPGSGNANELRKTVRRLSQEFPIKTVVLVGDVEHVPTHFEPALVNVKWGSEPEIASDNWLADLNDDVVPDIAIGRFCVDTPSDLQRQVQKVLAYETHPLDGMWPRRVHLIAGVGGFGAVADVLLENATRHFVVNGIPDGFRTSMTYASWRSPYCPDPRAFRNETINRLNEGALIWVYIGHGGRRSLDWIRVPAGVAPVFQEEDVAKVQCRSGMPIAVFLSCYAGAFDDPNRDCLAEQLVARSDGPVAAICGSRVTMPYGMTVMANEMLKECFAHRRPTLGEVILRAKQNTMRDEALQGKRRLLDAIAKTVSPEPDKLSVERKEHLWLMNLIGDPLLRIRYPRDIDLDVPGTAYPGDVLPIRFQCEFAGEAVLELTCLRGRYTFVPPKRHEFRADDAAMSTMSEIYRKVNDDCYLRQKLQVDAGVNDLSVSIPAEIRGPCNVRVFVCGQQQCAVGAERIYVRREKTGLAKPID